MHPPLLHAHQQLTQLLVVTHSSKEHEGEGTDPKTELNAILKSLQAWGHVEHSSWLSYSNNTNTYPFSAAIVLLSRLLSLSLGAWWGGCPGQQTVSTRHAQQVPAAYKHTCHPFTPLVVQTCINQLKIHLTTTKLTVPLHTKAYLPTRTDTGCARSVHFRVCGRYVPWVGSRGVAPPIEGNEPFLVNDRLAHWTGWRLATGLHPLEDAWPAGEGQGEETGTQHPQDGTSFGNPMLKVKVLYCRKLNTGFRTNWPCCREMYATCSHNQQGVGCVRCTLARQGLVRPHQTVYHVHR